MTVNKEKMANTAAIVGDHLYATIGGAEKDQKTLAGMLTASFASFLSCVAEDLKGKPAYMLEALLASLDGLLNGLVSDIERRPNIEVEAYASALRSVRLLQVRGGADVTIAKLRSAIESLKPILPAGVVGTFRSH